MRNYILVILLLLSQGSRAVTVEKSVDVTTAEKNPSVARRQLVDQAQTQAVEDLVRETLGAERFQKNKAAIQSKVLKMSSRLIPFSKAGELETLPDGTSKMTVLVRVNADDLDQLLMAQGLYFENDVPPVVLPAVVWRDQVNSEEFGWWAKEGGTALAPWSSEFEKTARESFLREGFFVLKPQVYRFQDALLSSFPLRLSAEDLQMLTQARGSQVVLSGEAVFTKEANGSPSLTLRLSVIHVPRNRILAQSSRKLSLEKSARPGVVTPKLRDFFENVSKDLASQSLESWQRGVLQSNPYKIVIAGALSPQDVESFREAFRAKVREVKNIRERLVTAQNIVFELDSPVAPKEMAQRVSEFELKGAKIQLKEVLPTELRFQTQTK